MSRTEDLARHYYTVVDAGDADTTVALFAPEATYDRPGYDTLTGPQIGEFYRGERVIVSGAHTVTEIIADGRRAAIRGTFDGVLKDGAEAHEGFADFMEFDDKDRIAKRTTYFFRAAV
ncbi:MAG: nuclear transport factor 2 family protein [Brevibacterium yomogidense]|uniref:nuclear transport factor 2 family protein n=1 Tax=Brevibacterium sp. Mu109 TaxID=1255669 RepID=UPI000C65FE18|nr:nuclear transport factor 2 family protein [Brevibacterium sp. Mu109]SMX71902.1 SnoaL-like domain-containing protein [Brevibacterium sp. Mu109]